jgi:hypothetical protein
LEHLQKNFKRKNEGIDVEIEVQRQLIRNHRDHETEREDITITRARQEEERESMIERHDQMLRCGQFRKSSEENKTHTFKITNAFNEERENLTQRHLTEMERFKETDNDDRQEVLRNRSIRKLKKKEVRNQQGRERQQFKDTLRYTSMTTDEQEKTLHEFNSTQKTKRKRQYNEITKNTAWQNTLSNHKEHRLAKHLIRHDEITKNTAWQNTLSNTTRPYASKQEMTKYYEIQRQRKLRYQRNNNLPITRFNYRTQENSVDRRKRRREDERQELHEKRQRQDMEQALETEQHIQEMRQALETNTRRHDWIQHRELEKEMITMISINEQDQEVHETYTREQWRAWDNYDERHEDAFPAFAVPQH